MKQRQGVHPLEQCSIPATVDMSGLCRPRRGGEATMARPFWAAMKGEPEVVGTLPTLSSSLEILAGLLALINPASVVSRLLGSPMN